MNLSSDKEQEYFSDGITEELLDALARVKGLKVAGRTSSFHFKGKSEDVRAIGEALGVANVLEGSVRKQGNRVRITAQLVQTADGFHRWSHTFEGDLSDVFDVQERIARAITDQLKVILQGDQRSRLVPVATSSSEAYALYLQATAIFNRRDRDRLADGIAQLDQALRLDPGFARAWSRLATLWALTASYRPDSVDSAHAAAEKAARRAIELDPSLAEPHAVLGLISSDQRHFLEASAAFRRALEIDPDDVTTNFWFASTRLCEGYVREANRLLDKVLLVDPMYPNALNWRALTAFASGDLDEADRLNLRAMDAGLAYVGIPRSYVAEARGKSQEAQELLFQDLEPNSRDLPSGAAEAIARGALGDLKSREEAVSKVRAYLATRPKLVNEVIPYALLRLGEPGEALEVLARGPTANDALPLPTLWLSYGREARRLPKFSDVARRMGLVDVWQEEGPPDLCEQVEPRKYVCR